MKRLLLAALPLVAIATLSLASHALADRPRAPEVTSIAVDPHAARALEGIRITFRNRANGRTISCTTDAAGGCTIARRFPGTHLEVFATQDGRRGPSRDIVIPSAGVVLVYVAVPPRA